jgi:Flp pilus assembly protein TadG
MKSRRKGSKGSMMVEFSLIATLLMVMFLGVIDLAVLMQQAMTATLAAQAGARYGASESNANDTTGMTNAAKAAAATISALAVTSTTWCTCSPGGAAVGCATTCNTYDLPLQYVQVSASVTSSLLFGFSGLPASIQLSDKATLRAK